MTIINACVFNPTTAAMVADEQSTNWQRNTKLAQKLDSGQGKNGSQIVFGGSGPSEMLLAISRRTLDQIPRHDMKGDLIGELQYQTTRQKQDVIDARLMAEFAGLTQTDLLRGYIMTRKSEQIPLAPETKQAAREAIANLRNQGLTHMGYLALAISQESIELYRIGTDFSIPILCSRPFDQIGSGSDMAEDELSDFVEALPRERHADIDPTEGLIALLKGTKRAANRNNGVGGVPMIKFVENGKIYTPTQNQSNLAQELVTGEKMDFLPYVFVQEHLLPLIRGERNWQELETNMFTQARSDWRDFNRHLRGYKD